MGPRTEPCGTPLYTVFLDTISECLTNCIVRPYNYSLCNNILGFSVSEICDTEASAVEKIVIFVLIFDVHNFLFKISQLKHSHL